MMPEDLYGKFTNSVGMNLEGLSLLEILPKHKVIVDDENRADCPFHDDADRSFHYGPSDDSFWCDICGADGKAVQFVMHYYNTDFRSALRHFGMNKSPGQVYEQRREAEMAKRMFITPPPPDETLVAAALDERIEKLQVILCNMETAIRLMQERSKHGENHRGISADESVAVMQSKVIREMLKRHDEFIKSGGVMLACHQQGVYDSCIAQYERWLTYTPAATE